MGFLSTKDRSDVESFFDRMFGEWPSFLDLQAMRPSQFAAPALDVYEKDGKYTMELAVPGYDPNEINVEVNGNMVTVTGTHTASTEKKDAHYHRREIRQGSFTRTVTLPQDVDPNGVDAKIDKGMLTISLMPSKPIAAKKIEIKGGTM